MLISNALKRMFSINMRENEYFCTQYKINKINVKILSFFRELLFLSGFFSNYFEGIEIQQTFCFRQIRILLENFFVKALLADFANFGAKIVANGLKSSKWLLILFNFASISGPSPFSQKI